MFNEQLLIYSFIVLLLTLTPGADTMLVLRNVFSSGKRIGIVTTLGICTGLLIYAVLSSFGISLIFTKSLLLYNLLKVAGAIYLMYLGFQSVAPILKDKITQNKLSISKENLNIKQAFFQGFISNILNPKITVFYLTFLPQFISPQENIILKSFFLTGIHIIMTITWLSFLSIFIGSIRKLYTSPKLKYSLEAISGMVMIIFAVLLLLEKK